MMKTSKNIYADLSYQPCMLYYPKEYFNTLKSYFPNLEEQILFGTDWWMSRFLMSQREYYEKFLEEAINNGINSEIIDRVTNKNAISFLGFNKNAQPYKNYMSFITNNNLPLPDWFKDI